MRRKYFSADGVIHTAISEDKAPRLDHSPRIIEKMNQDKNVCLNCKKKKMQRKRGMLQRAEKDNELPIKSQFNERTILRSDNMTNGLVKDRKTMFINGYAVQWFSQLLTTKVIIYANIHHNKYVSMAEMTLPYVANEKEVENVAKLKIEEIESL